MEFRESQKDMTTAYFGGALGVLVSGLVWSSAALVGSFVSNLASMLVLFIGGMLIFPISIALAKAFKRSGKHSDTNVLRHLAFEGLAILFVGLFIAYIIAQQMPNFFYPVMLLTIGARYLTFQTLYGAKIYWLLGAGLLLAGMLTAILNLPFIYGAYLGGIIELCFAMFMLLQNKTNAPTSDLEQG